MKDAEIRTLVDEVVTRHLNNAFAELRAAYIRQTDAMATYTGANPDRLRELLVDMEFVVPPKPLSVTDATDRMFRCMTHAGWRCGTVPGCSVELPFADDTKLDRAIAAELIGAIYNVHVAAFSCGRGPGGHLNVLLGGYVDEKRRAAERAASELNVLEKQEASLLATLEHIKRRRVELAGDKET